ncbi:glutathione S-transferase family protein [Massilia cavernae]|uniref:Glutathione S-transferase n=1 Tax=Massilia cavernae TaxID=2320864 RepID=A0A418Y7F5_9BURK|nr:glutathione binding-like protein [Massilia cavernae]RJG25872.1 glutathione S-transferase [Massilia cavernae]
MIDLYSAATPDGHMVSIALEELQLPYALHALDKQNSEQTVSYGRIPAINDRDEDNFVVFESGAILIYLSEKTGKLMPSDMKGRSKVLQWLMFQMGGIDAIKDEASRMHLFRVMDERLQGNEYLAGDYSIADIANWVRIRTHMRSGISVDDFPNLKRWAQAIKARSGVQRGLLMLPSSRDIEADLDESMEKFA